MKKYSPRDASNENQMNDVHQPGGINVAIHLDDR